MRRSRRFLIVVFLGALAFPAIASAQTLPDETTDVGPVTGFAMPRYVSMKAQEGYARRGPSRSHRIDWVYQHRNTPMQIIAEHGNWRRVVDRDGAGGWMHYSLLSGNRFVLIEVDMVELHQQPDAASTVRAQAELGVVARLDECQIDWCRLNIDGVRGWAPKSALWGVDPEEVF
jgi:SH3-like domain-containing protein